MNQGSQLASLLLLLLPLLLIGFMLWSARRRQKTMAEFTASLQTGDEIFLTSGIRGRVLELDERLARVEVAKDTVLTVDRRAIGMRADDVTGGQDTPETDERS